MKKIAIGIGILVVVLIVVCAFCGAILYIPTPDEDYPQDYTVEEYKDNIQKNRDLIVSKLEEINAPTLKETMKQYEKDADSLKLYPTALDTIEAAETKFIEDNRLPVLKKYRTERFMEKYYPNSLECLQQFEEDAYQAAEEGEYPKGYSAKSYTYKDGSVIQFNGGGMSIAYSNQ